MIKPATDSHSQYLSRFRRTDASLDKFHWPEQIILDREFKSNVSRSTREMFKSKLRFQIRHEDFRQRISQDEEDINSILNWYKLTDAVFLDYLSQDIKMTNSSAVWRYLIGYKNLLRAIENLGIAVVYGIRYYGQGNITEDNYVQFIKHDTISSEYLNQSRTGKAVFNSVEWLTGHFPLDSKFQRFYFN